MSRMGAEARRSCRRTCGRDTPWLAEMGGRTMFEEDGRGDGREARGGSEGGVAGSVGGSEKVLRVPGLSGAFSGRACLAET